MITVEEFMDSFRPRLEAWLREHNILAGMVEAGFQPVRLKRVSDLHMIVVTAHIDLFHEANFNVGPVTRIKHRLRARCVNVLEDRVELVRRDGNIHAIVGIADPP